MVITRITNASLDMILTAFDVKFRETKNEIPPGACRPPKKLNKKRCRKSAPPKVKKQKTMSIKRVPPPARPGGPGGAVPQEEEKGGIWTPRLSQQI